MIIDRAILLCLRATIVIIAIFCQASFADVGNFKTLDKSKGLLSDTSNSVIQDGQGFIWFGSPRGLSRFDGLNFKHFQHNPNNPSSLSHNWVETQYIDTDGLHWVGTRYGGINLFDSRTESFTAFLPDSKNDHSISHSWVTTIMQTRNGTIWIGTLNGINKFNKDTKEFYHYPFNSDLNNDPNEASISGIIEDERGNLWVATQGLGINYFNTESETYTHSITSNNSALLSNQVNALDISQTGNLLIATSKGLNILDVDLKTISAINILDNTDALKTQNIDSILEDHNEGLWLGTNHGLYYKGKEDNSFFKFSAHSDKTHSSIINEQIITIAQTKNSIVWISTGKGINYYIPKEHAVKFKSFSHKKLNDYNLYLGPSHIDDDGIWWVSTAEGFIKYDPIADVHTTFDYFSNSEKYIYTIFEDSKNNLWIGTQNDLIRFDKELEKFQSFIIDKDNSYGQFSNKILCVFEDKDAALWVGTFDGFFKLDSEYNIEESYSYNPNDNSLSQNKVAKIISDGTYFWIATKDGLNKFDPAKKIFKRYTSNIAGKASISFTGLVMDSKGDIWLSSFGAGLFRFNPKEELFKNFDMSDGLASNILLNIEITGEIAWLVHADGIIKFNIQDYSFQDFSSKHSFHNNFFKYNSIGKNKKYLLLSGDQGVDYFNFNENIDYEITANLVFNELLLFNKITPINPNDTSGILKSSINTAKEIILPHDHNIFSISFSNINFTDPELNTFLYRLKNFNEDWLAATSSNSIATFTNLPAGDYIFELKTNSENANQSAGSGYKRLNIKILPPPWKTWWAYLLYCLSTFLILAFLYFQNHKRIRAIKEKNRQLALTSKLFENTAEGVWLLDSNYNYITVNQGFLNITGHNYDEVIRRKFFIPDIPENKFVPDLDKILTSVRTGGSWQGEIWDVNTQGKTYPTEMVIDIATPRDQAESSEIQYLGMFSDITERKNHEKKLKQLAYYDSLTGLPNRLQFKNTINNQIVSKSHAENHQFALMFIDLDRFKIINDSLGHNKGDELLCIIANGFDSITLKNVSFARFGGDEFLVYITNDKRMSDTSTRNLENLCSDAAVQINKSISDSTKLLGFHTKITASIGVAFYPKHGSNFQSLLRSADTAMYSAKKSNKGSLMFFDFSMDAEVQAKFEIEQKMKHALANNHFEPYFQPKLSLHDGSSNNVEVLARWLSNNQFVRMPSEFIPVAEEVGLINEIAEQIFEKACRNIVTLIQTGEFTGKMAINLSPIQFQLPDLVERIDKILHNTNFPAENLELEITEGALLTNTKLVNQTLKRLKERNICIAIDDFGTGYSSLSYLAQYPISTLKIDSSFITDIDTSPKKRIIIKSIIKLAHSLDLSVVAEGVETHLQKKFLRSLACDEMQGFYFKKPLSAKHYLEFLT